MNKIMLFMIFLLLSSVAIINFKVQSNNKMNTSIAVMLKAHAAELEEVVIRCDTGGEGQCYVNGDNLYSIGPFGLPMCETTCEWSGKTNDFCVAGMPC